MNSLIARRCVGAALSILLLVLSASPSFAHAVLLSTTPTANAVIDAPPSSFDLAFNEPVSLLTASLITPDGEQIDISDGAENGSSVRLILPDEMTEGTYVVSWRIVSVDGHPVGGATPFSIGVVTGAAGGETVTDPTVSALLWGSKAILFTAIFFGLGSAVFGGVVAPLGRPTRTLVIVLIGAGLLAAPTSLGLQGADALARDVGSLLSAASWQAALATSYGWTAVAVFIALGLAALSLFVTDRSIAISLSVLAGLVAPLALALSGHASAAEPQWLMRPAVFVHVAGIIFWAGALVPLASLLARPADIRPLARFSTIIPYAVGMVLVSGAILIVVQMGRDLAQWTSPYGLILAAKLGLLAILFGLALWNRIKLTAPAVAGNAGAQRGLRAVIVCEIIVIGIILGLVAAWRFTPPPRALALIQTVPISFHIHTEQLMADVALEPGRVGANSMSIYVMDGDFAPVDPLEVKVALSVPELGIEATRVDAHRDEDGFWRVDDVTLPVPAEWHMSLEVRLSRFDLVRLAQTFTLP